MSTKMNIENRVQVAEKIDAGDRLLILEALYRYARGFDARDLDMLGDSFATDAKFGIHQKGTDGWGSAAGRENIVEWLQGFMKQQTDKRNHCISNAIFTSEDKNHPKVVSILTLTAAKDQQVRLVTSGDYYSEMVKEDGVWRIKQLDLHLDGFFE